MRVILGTTNGTPTETMQFMLDLPLMQTRQKVEQVKAYISAIEKTRNPLHEAMKTQKAADWNRASHDRTQAKQVTGNSANQIVPLRNCYCVYLNRCKLLLSM